MVLKASKLRNAVPPYTTKWIDVPIDHFSFPQKAQTFHLRYLLNDQYFSGNDAPIFFYTGNEGSIEDFYNNSGVVFEWAKKFNGLIVFCEHRYYGKSKVEENKNLQWLTSEQALVDYTYCIKDVRRQYKKAGKLIAFGGSLGGMQAFQFRLKYPAWVAGAIAASAPVLSFQDHVDPYAFMKIVSDDFKDEGEFCSDAFRRGFQLIDEYANHGKYKELSSIYRTCSPLSSAADARKLKQLVNNGAVYMAMLDYATATEFLEPLPAWPVKVTCSKINKTLSDRSGEEKYLYAHVDALQVYFNTSGTATCFDIGQPGNSADNDLGYLLWSFQACSEMIMPFGSNGKTDMFYSEPWDLNAYVEYCRQEFKVEPQPYQYIERYMPQDVKSYSNVFFSNGRLDPWRSGGVFSTENPTVIPHLIKDGAHHADLRSTTDSDPASIKEARRLEEEVIAKWLAE